jgi:hypothetical protein
MNNVGLTLTGLCREVNCVFMAVLHSIRYVAMAYSFQAVANWQPQDVSQSVCTNSLHTSCA